MSLLNYRPVELMDAGKFESDRKNVGENLTFVSSKNDTARSAAYFANTKILEEFHLENEIKEVWE